MQLVASTADDAFASITFPNLKLHSSRYYSSSFWPKRHRTSEVFFTFDCLEPELEYRSIAELFGPRIEEMKHAII